MSSYEQQQWAGLIAGGLVALAVVVALVRWDRRVVAIFPDAAVHYGLAFARMAVGNLFTGRGEHLTLRGQARGVRVDVLARNERTGRLRTSHTRVVAAVSLPVRPCTLTVSRAPPLHTLHLVRTGDATFDAQRSITCDAPEVTGLVFTPPVREAALRCPQDTLQLEVTGDHVVLSWPSTPLTALELRAPLELVLAVAALKPSAPVRAGPIDGPADAASPHDALALAGVFGIPAEHLEANRQGRLHPDQLALLYGLGGGESLWLLLAAVLCAGGGLGAGIYVYDDRLEPTLGAFLLPAMMGGVPASVLFVGYLWTRAQRRARHDAIATGAPQTIEGPVRPWEVRGHGVPPRCGFDIGGRTFASNRSWNARLTPGAYYRVYFMYDVVLSIEPTRIRGA